LQESFVLRVSLAAFLLILLILVLKIYLQRSELAQDLSQKLKSNRDKSELTELKG
jgi:Na+-transporting NADH:ubiquinone oxidoreductase subunit NqrF